LGGKVYVPSGPGTGYEVAQFLLFEHENNTPQIIVHSFNPTGAQNMQELLSKKFLCVRAPIGGDHFNEIIKQINV